MFDKGLKDNASHNQQCDSKDSGHKQRPELNFAIRCLHGSLVKWWQKSVGFSRNPQNPLEISFLIEICILWRELILRPLTQNAELNPAAKAVASPNVPVNTFSLVCVAPRKGCFCSSQVYQSLFCTYFSYKKQLIRNGRLSFWKSRNNPTWIYKVKNVCNLQFNFPRSLKSVWKLCRNSNCLAIILSANYVLFLFWHLNLRDQTF